MRLRTDHFEFDPATGEVHRDGTIYRLEPQPAALLALLMSRPGQLLTRQEAIRALWGDHTSVSFQDGINYNIRQVRVALNDRVREPRYVETIPRRGYRFVAAVDRSPAPADRSGRPPRTAARRWAAAALCGVMLAAATVVIERHPNRHHEIAVTILKSIHDRLF
jgi:DNA-binding winged helix-turn-helix (wHTH) protein